MSNFSYFTPEGLQKLKDEIHHLKTVERPRISQQIAEARDKGDLSENAEYDAAKEAQGMMEARLVKLENTLANARLVDDSLIDNTKVYILSTVKLRNQKNNAEVTYTLVAENEANLAEKKISVESPIGRGLLGKAVGDVAEVQVPAGLIPFEVLEIDMDFLQGVTYMNDRIYLKRQVNRRAEAITLRASMLPGEAYRKWLNGEYDLVSPANAGHEANAWTDWVETTANYVEYWVGDKKILHLKRTGS
jgi:transcription elongation factor GreA